MKRGRAAICLAAWWWAGTAHCQPPAPIPVLIVDGVNNHDWKRLTLALREILTSSGLFRVDVSTSPARDAPASEWAKWRPEFRRYRAVISNFNGGHNVDALHWPPEVELAFERYVGTGGGFVAVHAANNSFPAWDAYNAMIGLGWRERTFGRSLIVMDGKVVTVPAGEGLNPGHGPPHDFEITVLNKNHPITRGMPDRWLHPRDQLSHGQRGPALNLTVLTYAYSRDSRQNEVIDWVTTFGRGRVYVTMLGHTWPNQPAVNLESVGFQTMLIRGAEWAATGRVTYPIPADFPSAGKISRRPLKLEAAEQASK